MGTLFFTELLYKIAILSAAEQREILEKELARFQGNEEQRDDITVIGIKI